MFATLATFPTLFFANVERTTLMMRLDSPMTLYLGLSHILIILLGQNNDECKIINTAFLLDTNETS